MYIDAELCEKCLACLPLCPVSAIVVADKRVTVDEEECVECGVCRRSRLCPTGAIKQWDEIPYPRAVRAAFSDPTITHTSTGIAGRGTEEMKTNDITHHFERGRIGFSIELGRPGVGTRLSELDKLLRKVAPMGVEFAEDNPVIQLMSDRATGALKAEFLGEKVLSAIVEVTVPEQEALGFLHEIGRFIDEQLDTVVTVSMIVRANEDGSLPFLESVRAGGFRPYPNGKVNLGMAVQTGGRRR